MRMSGGTSDDGCVTDVPCAVHSRMTVGVYLNFARIAYFAQIAYFARISL